MSPNENNSTKSLSEILDNGRQWQHELSIVIIEICKRLEKLEVGCCELSKK